MEYYSKFVKFLENYEDGADKVVQAIPSVAGVTPFKIVK